MKNLLLRILVCALVGVLASGHIVAQQVTNLSTMMTYSTLQAANDAASDGDTLFVANGTYNENLAVNKSLVFVGESQMGVVVRGPYTGGANVIFAGFSNITIANLTITRDYGANLAAWYACGVNQLLNVGQGTTDLVVDGVLFKDGRNAIFINNSQNNTIQNCMFENNRTAVHFGNNVSNCEVLNNTFIGSMTHDVLFNYDLATQLIATGVQVHGNSFSGWYSAVNLQHNNGNPSFVGDATGLDISCNTYENGSPNFSATSAAEPGYTSQVPIQFGGVDPMLNNDIMGIEANLVLGTYFDALSYSETPGRRTASDGLANDQLGWGLALDGSTAMAGAPDDKVGTQSKQGSAYIFQQNEGGTDNWGQLKQIKSTDGAAVDYFGNAISLDGSTALLAAHGDNVGTVTDAGAVYIFEQNHLGPNFWGQKAQIFARDGATDDWAAYDYFGGAVSLKNGRAIVGASKKKVGTKNAQGAAYIFEQNAGGPDNWGNVKKLTASDGAANNFFGQSVAQFGNLALVGANGNNSNRGAAYFFDGAAAWAQTQKLTASDAAVGDGFGASVSMTSDYALIGAPNKSTYAGAAYVFKNNAGTWTQLKKLVASDGATNDRFGSAVVVMDDYAYVSAILANGAGAVYVFHKDMGGANNWGQIGKYTASDGAANDRFGYSLAVSGDKMAIGANLDDVATKADQGSIYIFTGADCPDVPKPGSATTSQAELGSNLTAVKCSPNPFRDELTIEVSAQGATHLQVTDAAGRLMVEADLPAGATRFDLNSSTFRGGLYFVQVSGENGVRVVPVALVR